jgi:hypothetical protein
MIIEVRKLADVSGNHPEGDIHDTSCASRSQFKAQLAVSWLWSQLSESSSLFFQNLRKHAKTHSPTMPTSARS